MAPAAASVAYVKDRSMIKGRVLAGNSVWTFGLRLGHTPALEFDGDPQLAEKRVAPRIAPDSSIRSALQGEQYEGVEKFGASG